MKGTANKDRSSPPSSGPAEAPPDDPPRHQHSLRLAPEVAERFDRLEKKLDRLYKKRDADALLTEQEAADLLGVTPRTMQTMRAAGEISALRVRGCIRYTRAAVQSYIRRQAKAGAGGGS